MHGYFPIDNGHGNGKCKIRVARYQNCPLTAMIECIAHYERREIDVSTFFFSCVEFDGHIPMIYGIYRYSILGRDDKIAFDNLGATVSSECSPECALPVVHVGIPWRINHGSRAIVDFI